MNINYNDIYEDYEILKLFDQEGFYDVTYPNSINESKKIYKKVFKSLLNLLEEIKYNPKNEHTVFMSNIERFSYIASVLSKSFNVLTFSRVKINRNSFDLLKYYPVDFDERLYKGFMNKDIKYAKNVVEDISGWFVRNNVEVVVLSCDRSFLERAIVFAAKEKNIPIVIFQHGIFIGDDVPKTKIGIYGNQYWVWCQYIKDKFIDAFGNENRKVRVMGYPFPTINGNFKSTKRVLFIGADYSNLNSEYDKIYKEVALNVFKVCQDLGLEFCFRPHPNINKNELKREYSQIKNFKFSNINNLMDDMGHSSIIVGDFSSVLLEAALIRKPVIQIDWGGFVHELLKNKMYSFSVKVNNTYEQIRDAMEKIMENRVNTEIEDYYLHRNPQFEQDIIKWIEEIIYNKKDNMKYNYE